MSDGIYSLSEYFMLSYKLMFDETECLWLMINPNDPPQTEFGNYRIVYTYHEPEFLEKIKALILSIYDKPTYEECQTVLYNYLDSID